MSCSEICWQQMRAYLMEYPKGKNTKGENDMKKDEELVKMKTRAMLRQNIILIAGCIIIIALISYFWNNPIPSEYHYLVTH